MIRVLWLGRSGGAGSLRLGAGLRGWGVLEGFLGLPLCENLCLCASFIFLCPKTSICRYPLTILKFCNLFYMSLHEKIIILCFYISARDRYLNNFFYVYFTLIFEKIVICVILIFFLHECTILHYPFLCVFLYIEVWCFFVPLSLVSDIYFLYIENSRILLLI